MFSVLVQNSHPCCDIFSAEIDDEEMIEFDFEGQITVTEDLVIDIQSVDINAVPKISWLYQEVLSN